MKRVVPDTNVWLHVLTGKVKDVLVDGVSIFSSEVMILLPFTVKAELLSIGKQRG